MSQLLPRSSRALCLLSFDGGGIRGLSSLFILREIMRRLNARLEESNPQHQQVEPWEVFDMICGTSTGGLIAIMLGRLHMSVDDTIKAYVELSESIFSKPKWWWQEGRYRASALERAVKLKVGENTLRGPEAVDTASITKSERDDRYVQHGQTVQLADSYPSENQCPVFVCATPAEVALQPLHLRTYKTGGNKPSQCAIWEAARATSAAPYFFKPAVIKEDELSTRYVDGGLGNNNPTAIMLKEARVLFHEREVTCILSLGTGHRNVIRLRPAGGIPRLQLLGVVGVLRDIATDCETTHHDLARRFQGSNVYFRFNVEQGLQQVGLEEWKRLSQVQAHTRGHMQRFQVNADIDTVVARIVNRQGGITI